MISNQRKLHAIPEKGAGRAVSGPEARRDRGHRDLPGAGAPLPIANPLPARVPVPAAPADKDLNRDGCVARLPPPGAGNRPAALDWTARRKSSAARAGPTAPFSWATSPKQPPHPARERPTTAHPCPARSADPPTAPPSGRLPDKLVIPFNPVEPCLALHLQGRPGRGWAVGGGSGSTRASLWGPRPTMPPVTAASHHHTARSTAIRAARERDLTWHSPPDSFW